MTRFEFPNSSIGFNRLPDGLVTDIIGQKLDADALGEVYIAIPTLALCIILEDGLQILTLCRIDVLLLSEERDSGWQFLPSLTEGYHVTYADW